MNPDLHFFGKGVWHAQIGKIYRKALRIGKRDAAVALAN
jgi:hypothetical protein